MWALPLRDKVIVSLKTGNGVSGVLIRRRGGFLLLKAASLHEPGREPVVMDGEVFVAVRDIDYIQRPGV